MKYVILLIAIQTFLFSQEWDNSKWEKLKFYDSNVKLDDHDRAILDIKCFDSGDCFAVGLYQSFYLEVFKYSDSLDEWDRVYDGIWNPFGSQEKWPDIIEQPYRTFLLSDTTVCIYYYQTPLINIFNFITGEYDTTHYQPAYDFLNMTINENGYGMGAIGNFVYTTKNYWKEYNYKDIEFPSTAFKTPVSVLRDNRFALVDYYEGKCYFTVSTDGLNWERYPVGPFYAFNIYFMDAKIGFIVGSVAHSEDDTRDDVIYKTRDGGKTWYEVLNQYNDPSWGIGDLVMLKGKYGIATSMPGLIYTTTDQGETWPHEIMDSIDIMALGVPSVTFDNGKCYVIVPRQGVLSYDEDLLGITSVPIYNYKLISVYPNPFKSELNIISDEQMQGSYTLKLFSADGKLEFTKKIFVDKGLKFDIDVPAGTYYMLLEGKNYFYSKIVKE